MCTRRGEPNRQTIYLYDDRVRNIHTKSVLEDAQLILQRAQKISIFLANSNLPRIYKAYKFNTKKSS